MSTYSPQSLGINEPTGGFQQGGWYSGRQFWGGTLSDPGSIHPDSDQVGAGKRVSNDVVKQTSPNNVSFIESQIQASDIQAPVEIPYTPTSNSLFSGESLSGQVDKYRANLEKTLGARKAEVDSKLSDLRAREKEALASIGELTTPFREELEEAERERLYVNENFEANQNLVNELDQLLTEGNNLIRQQQEVTGLAAVRNPRIQQTMDDVAARAGVIEAVINARNGQIAQAQNLIDRTAGAIAADRQDQISYYETVINLNNRDIISLDAESKKIAEEQLNLKKSDLQRAQATQDYVKQLLIDPATASLMGDAGIKLTDSVEQINGKIREAEYIREVKDQANEITLKGGKPVLDPSGVPANQLLSFTDSRGREHYFKIPGESRSGLDSNSFIASVLAGDPSADLSQFTTPITTTDYVDLTNIANEVVAPSMSPRAGIGSRFVDSLGRTWIYERNGWRLSN